MSEIFEHPDAERDGRRSRRTYEAPKLIVYGDVKALTASGISGTEEGAFPLNGPEYCSGCQL